MSKTPYFQVERTLKESDLWISSNDFYNLERSSGTHSKEEALRLTLAALAREEFHVRLYEKYVITTHGLEEKTVRTVEHFIFCSGEQIEFVRRFVSGFLLQTDATFDNNQLNMPLSTIIGITNTMKTFPIGYCFITSESAEAFNFIHSSLQDMVFYDCPGPSVVLGDFTAGLSASMKDIQKMSI